MRQTPDGMVERVPHDLLGPALSAETSGATGSVPARAGAALADKPPVAPHPPNDPPEGIDLHPLAACPDAIPVLLFSESNTRFLCEVRPEHALAFATAMADVPHALIGEVADTGKLEILGIPRLSEQCRGDDSGEITVATVLHAELAALKEAWQKPLRW